MMKKRIAAIACLFCLLSSGCNSEAGTVSGEETLPVETNAESAMAEETTVEETEMRVTVIPTTAAIIKPLVPATGETNESSAEGDTLAFDNADGYRIAYTMNQNSVTYITSAEGLPVYDIEALKAYDEDFFKEKALVLVKETVNSGSTKVGIQSIIKEGSVISVTLSHEGAEIGTTDMATWLLWAEVDRGLENCQWVLTNPALPSQLEVR